MRDIVLEATERFKFTTRAFATGVPTTLGGTPVLSVLEENNATPITAGVSVSVDRASVTGLNEATIVATAANGYENGKSYGIYVSTGTVGGTSVVGEVIEEFTIGASAAVQSLDAGVDVTRWGGTALDGVGDYPELGIIDSGVAQTAAAANITLRAVGSFSDNDLVGATITITSATAGTGQSRIITGWDNTTKIATVDAWNTLPTGTRRYVISGTAPPDQTNIPPVNTEEINAATVLGNGTGGDLWRG